MAIRAPTTAKAMPKMFMPVETMARLPVVSRVAKVPPMNDPMMPKINALTQPPR